MLIALIMAGGFGSRFNSNIPKQYHKIDGEFILQKTINVFTPLADKIIVVIAEKDEEIFTQNFKNIEYTFGGEKRQKSVLNGLKYASKYSPKFTLITDGARPFTSNNTITSIINALHLGEIGVIPCIKAFDTVKKANNGYIEQTLNRDEIFFAQTPQGFDFKTILSLHEKYQNLNFTDDASLLEQEGIKVKIVDGERENIKITIPEDII